jgi:hypothetical protein
MLHKNYIDDIGLVTSKKKAVHTLTLDYKAVKGYVVYYDEKLGWCQCRAIDPSYQPNRVGDKTLEPFRQAQWAKFAGRDPIHYRGILKNYFCRHYYLTQKGLFEINNPLGEVVTEKDLLSHLYALKTNPYLQVATGICARIYRPELFGEYDVKRITE